MAPKKPLSSRAMSQKSLTQSQIGGLSYERKPQPLPAIPDSSSVPPLWTPASTPKELFPEWPSAAALATENWGSDDAPFEDPTPPVGFGLSESTRWKRPSEFLAPIPEPAPPAPLPPVVPDAKHAKKPAPPPGKKAEPEPPKKPKAPRYAHIVHVPSSEHHNAPPPPHVPAPVATDSKKRPTATASHPSTPAVVAPPQPPPHRTLHDFRRLWSAEQQEDWALWRQEEERVERDKQHRERVYMEFEDATAFIINGRPRLINEDDVNADDLEDDGEEEDEPEDGISPPDNSPFGGLLPPQPIEIASNAIVKPKIPHGDVVQPEFASCFRIVDQLYQGWMPSPTPASSPDSPNVPYLWEAIYPQDPTGVPVYNHAGKYSVRLFIAGKWRRVDVDDKLPLDEEGNIQTVSSSMKNELWATILGKALIKVANWFRLDECVQEDDSYNHENRSIRLTSLIISALTGWKVTRQTAANAGNYQVLQEYVTQGQTSAVQNEFAIEGIEDTLNDNSEPPSDDTSEKSICVPKPRAIISCTSPCRNIDIACGESCLLFEVVGDPGSLNFKLVNLNGRVSIAEESLSPDSISFLLVHPPPRNADLLFETWTRNQSGILEPFRNPATQYCVVSMMKTLDSKTPGDDTGEPTMRQSDFVNVLVTLARIPPHDDVEAERSRGVAKHLGVDPRGSVILVEDLELEKYLCRSNNSKPATRRPMVYKIDSSASSFLQLPRGDLDGIVFRVYPQSSCRYGYSLLVESDAKVDWQISSICWRNVWDLQVIEGDGAYPVMLPGSWNVLLKQSIELAPPADGSSHHQPEIHVDLHLTDPDLSPMVHMSIVSHQDDLVIPLSGLHAGAVLPHEAVGYTLIVECRPRNLVPDGKWHVTLGSNRFFKHATIHQPRLTVFSGNYTPNKPLVCLRDVLVQPKKTTSTSLQFELLDAESKRADSLAANVEVLDLASGELLAQHSGYGLVRLLQLPPYSKTVDDPNEEKSGCIIQCGIDKTKCHVPLWGQSVRPFTFKQWDPPKSKVIEEGQDGEESIAETNEDELRWRLSWWSVDEVKLEFDRTQELKFEAIRAGWAEAAKDRDAHGASSRLMFLGKMEAASAAMAEDGLSEEQIARYKACVDWFRQSGTRVPGLKAEDFIRVGSESKSEVEVLRQPEDFARDHELNQMQAETINALLQSIREERARAKETRSAAVKELLQSFRDERKKAENQRRALYAQHDEVQAQIKAQFSSQ